jgi:hypothetical protein
MTVGAAALLAGMCVSGCSDRPAGPTIDWPAPQQITGRMHDNCVIVDGGLKCWFVDRGAEDDDPEYWENSLELVLALREEPFPQPLPFADVDGGAEVLSVWSSLRARCVVLAEGGVKCWGDNEGHVLGLPDPDVILGDEPEERGASIPFVDLGSNTEVVAVKHPCALFGDGGVKCWGRGDARLGLGDLETRGDDLSEMGDALPYVDLGTGVRAVGLTGWAHMCIWTAEGQVKCWGRNDRGQLGIESGDEAVGDEPGEMGDALPFVDLGEDVFVVQVAAGQEHTCALTDEGRVKCWGANSTVDEEYAPHEGPPDDEPIEVTYHEFGRLGLGETLAERRAPLADTLPYVDLGEGARAVAIDTGTVHTCALLEDATVKCWGENTWGILGYGDTENRGDGPGEMGDALPAVDVGLGRSVRAFAVSSSSTCAWLDDDSIRCWGGGFQAPLASDTPERTGDGLPLVVTREDLLGPSK